MKYFIDTEFHEHKRPVKFLGITIKKVWTIDLISIGIKCEDGREYYAINRDLNLKYAKKDSWLKKNVIDKLPAKRELYPPHGSPRLWQESMRWLPMEQIKQEVIDFCGGKSEITNDYDGKPYYEYKNNDLPEFYGYYGSYDWVVFCWIFGRMLDLPNGFPMYIKDLKQMLDEYVDKQDWYYGRDCWSNTGSKDLQEKDRPATFSEKLKKVKGMSAYPKQENEHNALDDANWNFNLYKFLSELVGH
jgi:hypothetical protein